MADLIDEFNALKIKVAKAIATNDQATLHRKIHLIDHEEEKQRKRTNPAKSTRISLNCRTPEQWTEFQMAKERYFELISDPHIALDLMIRALKAPTDEELKAWLAAGHQQAGDAGPAPERASIPDWAK